MKRTKLADRLLPDYTRGEEIMNMVTHIVGGVIGIVALMLCVIRAALNDNLYGTPGPQSRHALHAFKLCFIHPVSDKPLEITRTLPEDLRKIIYY